MVLEDYMKIKYTINKVSNFISNTWNWLDGKKTTIGTVIWAVAGGLKFIPSMKPYSEFLDYSMEVGYAISIGGIGHKAIKSALKTIKK